MIAEAAEIATVLLFSALPFWIHVLVWILERAGFLGA